VTNTSHVSRKCIKSVGPRKPSVAVDVPAALASGGIQSATLLVWTASLINNAINTNIVVRWTEITA